MRYKKITLPLAALLLAAGLRAHELQPLLEPQPATTAAPTLPVDPPVTADQPPAGNAIPPLEPPAHFAQIARTVGWALPQAHLLQFPLNDQLSARAWTNYLAMLDYDRAYFLQSDIDEFAAQRDKIDDYLRDGNLDFAYTVHARFRQRLAERYHFVTNSLAQGLDFSVKESYDWKRKDAPWPATPAAQDDLWRQRIKNEYLAYQISRAWSASNRLERATATNTTTAAQTPEAAAPAVEEPEPGTIEPAAPLLQPNAGTTNSVPIPTPEEFLCKRYEQFKIVIDDSDADWVLERYLGAVAGAYDPHTTYMPPTAVEDFNIDMNLSLSGIGALLSPEDGAAKINEIIPGGPAARDERDIRLVPGDKIIGVGQDTEPIEDVLHLPLNKIVRKIRGPKGTRVVLQVISADDPSGSTTRLIDLIRDDVRLEEQAATGHVARVTLADGRERALGVVRLPTFYGSMTSNRKDPDFRSCTLDIANIITAMNDEIEGLILDLRGNGGGSLREAIDLTGRFIRLGPVVQQREGRRLLVHVDRDPAITFRKPLIVLVNRASASASEIVAAALQDYGRALIVGDSRTHGKGTVQTIIPLSTSDPRLGSLKVTIASYYRISGGSTQLHGVEADILLPSVLEHWDLGEDKLPNAIPWDQIASTDYSPVYNIQPFVPTLASNLQARLATDERYQRHLRSVNHVREARDKTSLPLDYETRYREYAAERALQQAEAAAEGDDAAEEEPTAGRRRRDRKQREDDVILDATLQLLSDLVDLQGPNAIDSSLDRNALDAQYWLRRIFAP